MSAITVSANVWRRCFRKRPSCLDVPCVPISPSNIQSAVIFQLTSEFTMYAALPSHLFVYASAHTRTRKIFKLQRPVASSRFVRTSETSHSNHKKIIILTVFMTGSCFGGLEVACWPLVPKFAGSNPTKAVGFFSTPSFGGEIKPSVPCLLYGM
jgi:hypothetical protein